MEQDFAFDAGKAQVQNVGGAFLFVAVDLKIHAGFVQRIKEGCFHLTQMLVLGFPIGQTDLRRQTQSTDIGEIFRPGAESPFLTAAVDQRRDTESLPDIQTADALGRAELMTAQGKSIDTGLFQINGNAAVALNAVHMKDAVGIHPVDDFGNFF